MGQNSLPALTPSEEKKSRSYDMMQLLCDSVLSYERNRWKYEHVIRNNIGKQNMDKYFEIWTFYT